jgi:hypothetical protein
MCTGWKLLRHGPAACSRAIATYFLLQLFGDLWCTTYLQGSSILAALERQLAKGDKALVGNTGYRRYLKTICDDHFAIDPDGVEEDQKFDGIFMLRSVMMPSASGIAACVHPLLHELIRCPRVYCGEDGSS